MKYAFYLALFMVGQVLVAGSVAVLVARHTIDQYDHSPKPETIVVKELPETRVEARSEAKPETNLGRMVRDNQRPLAPAGWKVGEAVRSGEFTMTPAVGPHGEEVVVLESSGPVDFEKLDAEVVKGMQAGGWKKESDGSWWNMGKYAATVRMWDRNASTTVIGKGKNATLAREAAEAFVGK